MLNQLFPYLFSVFTNFLVVLIIAFLLRSLHWLKNRNDRFFEISSWKSSLGSRNGVISLIVAVSLASASSISLTSIDGSVADLGTLVTDLDKTASQLALQGRTAISDFEEFRRRSVSMLESVDNKDTSEVKVALFWPMFGADSGEEFLKFINEPQNSLPFSSRAENEFYYYLFRRIDHDMPTKMLLLDYRNDKKNKNKKSELHRFIATLGKYEVPFADGNKSVYDENIVKKLEDAVVQHISQEIIPEVESSKRVDLRVTQNLPVVLFTVENKDKDERQEQKALLFIGNVDMLSSQSQQGGFYTEDEEMVKILVDFYKSLYCKAEKVVDKRDLYFCTD